MQRRAAAGEGIHCNVEGAQSLVKIVADNRPETPEKGEGLVKV